MKNIVVIGTGVAGMPLIRQTMRNVVLPSSDYKLTVISPNSDFFWPIGMPRAVVPGQFSDNKIAYPLAPIFKDYPAEKFEFIQEAASKVDPDRKTVAAGGREVEYHTLIIASGSRTKDEFPWKIVGTSEETKKALHKAQKEIEAASSIAVIGGGVTGLETAGELGFEYSREGKKDVHLIYNGELPLAPINLEKVRKQAVLELERLNVKMIPSTQVTKTTRLANGETKLELTKKDGSVKTLTVGAVLPATGMVPNTSFLPPSMLNESGNVLQDGYLRALKYPNIFVVGDAGALEPSKVMFANDQTIWLIKHLPRYFSHNGELPSEPYKKDGSEIKNVEVFTLGRSKGAGHFGTWRIPSLAIWWIKGRYLGTNYAGELAAGKRMVTEVFEK
jgi:NADH dehydrogenase FAD-containing subunit